MKGRNTKKGSFSKGEDAVSPVIGVILMVAITVILAAVIGAFVFGMGSGVSKTYTVGVTAAQTGSNTIDVTFQGGPDANAVHYINVSVGGNEYRCDDAGDSDAVVQTGGAPVLGTGDDDDDSVVAVGSTVILGGSTTASENEGITAERDHLIATATFLDGSKQVVLDTYV